MSASKIWKPRLTTKVTARLLDLGVPYNEIIKIYETLLDIAKRLDGDEPLNDILVSYRSATCEKDHLLPDFVISLEGRHIAIRCIIESDERRITGQDVREY